MKMKWTTVVEALEYEIEDHESDLKTIADESVRRHALVHPPWKMDGRTYDEELGCTVSWHEEQIEALKIALELVRSNVKDGFTNVILFEEGNMTRWKE
jgi:hypothetical protein